MKVPGRRKIGSLGIIVFSAAAITVAEAAVVLDFDALAPGSWVSNSYQSVGVIFDVPGWDVRDETFGGIVLVPSNPNYARLPGQAPTTTLRFTDPTDPVIPATTTSFAFDNPGLVASSGFYAGLNLVAKDLSGQVVGAASIPFVGPYEGRATFTTTIQAVEIHSIEFTYVANPWAQALLPIDNVRFNEVTPALFATIQQVLGTSEIEICWNSRSDKVYQVQYRSDLGTNQWTDLLAPIIGTGGTNCVADTLGSGQSQRFYRVVEQP